MRQICYESTAVVAPLVRVAFRAEHGARVMGRHVRLMGAKRGAMDIVPWASDTTCTCSTSFVDMEPSIWEGLVPTHNVTGTTPPPGVTGITPRCYRNYPRCYRNYPTPRCYRRSWRSILRKENNPLGCEMQLQLFPAICLSTTRSRKLEAQSCPRARHKAKMLLEPPGPEIVRNEHFNATF